MLRQDTVRAERQTSDSSLLASAVDTYDLEKTLDAYEVEELDGHDLARFLPVTMIAAKTGGLS